MKRNRTLILGIETSCDETAAAVVADGRVILSNVVASQEAIHAKYGGVFPEVASRQHVLTIVPVVQEAMEQAGVGWGDLTAVAVTYGPGLAGSLLVGLNMAKAVALAHDLPLLGINHLEGHLYSNWLIVEGRKEEAEPRFPLLGLIVSGGHTDLVLMTDHGQYQVLGRTLDDAAGEAFDKVGRLLGLPYPGGPSIQEAAKQGSRTAFNLPRAWLKGSYNFSFSGLKTAVLRIVQKYQKKGTPPHAGRKGTLAAIVPTVTRPLPVANLAASFQEAVVDVLVEKTRQAAEEHEVREVLLAGGVASNLRLRQRMKERLRHAVRYPPPYLCTDNAAMIAAAGYYAWRSGRRSDWGLDVEPSAGLV
ncbi:MAG: tRNA (adenosine(37)-N6)-threonylcarbamoyltransferase complex transferase subunit TsaD [Anaerolineae bacterium]